MASTRRGFFGRLGAFFAGGYAAQQIGDFVMPSRIDGPVCLDSNVQPVRFLPDVMEVPTMDYAEARSTSFAPGLMVYDADKHNVIVWTGERWEAAWNDDVDRLCRSAQREAEEAERTYLDRLSAMIGNQL